MARTVLFVFLYHLTCFSMANECFTMVDTCPDTNEKWTKRSNEYNCTSGRFYTCLMNDNMTLAEACTYPHYIEATREGCPVFALCTEEYGPLIDNDLKPCKKGIYECPSSNHSGYNLTEMFKFPGCFKHVVANRENEAAISQQRTTHTLTTSPNTDSSENEVLILKIVITCISIPIILAIFFIVFLLVRHIQAKPTESNIYEEDCETVLLPPEQTNENSDVEITSMDEQLSKKEILLGEGNVDNINENPETQHHTIQETVGIPSEVMHYLVEVDYKPVLSNLNLTTMTLLSKAPKAIGLVGRLHFIAILTSFEIGIDSDEGKELCKHASALGENSEECFTVAKENFQKITISMSDVIMKLNTLSSMMRTDCMTKEDCEMIIDLVTKNVNQCIEFCKATETLFKGLQIHVKPLDCSLERAKAKIDDKYNSGSKITNDSHLNRVKPRLQNISRKIEKTSQLFEELGKNWKTTTDFFVNMRLFLKVTVKNDIDLSSRSLLSYGQGTARTVSLNGNKTLPKILLDKLCATASYARIVSVFYVFVSSEIFAESLQMIRRSLYVKDQMTPTDIESSMERLQKICTDARDHVLYLCKSIEQLIKR